MCLGEDPARIGPLMRSIEEKLHVFGRSGPFTYARSAIDIALWDIAGKVSGAQLHRLLGGAATELTCYASLDAFAGPARVRAGVRQAIDAGFRTLKLHEQELSAIHAARAEAGSDAALILDANCAWTVTQARTRAEQLRGLDLKWLEEPVWPPENYDGFAHCATPPGSRLPPARTPGR